ncbi:hypothetical protein [Myroides odoratus]|uniref:hypothetical protein n=1 Tax=Myroides odoratus TaxID=256 RepID=UPI0007661C34|nr:hypothetical protein [Myroides odoratus]
MKKKKIVISLLVVGFLFSCTTNRKIGEYQEIPDYIEYESLQLTYLDKIKRNKYYLIQAINNKNEVVYIISYTRNKNSFTNPSDRQKIALRKGEIFDFVTTSVFENLVQNFSYMRHIIILKDTIWSNVEKDNRLFQSKPKIYQGINTVGLTIYQ